MKFLLLFLAIATFLIFCSPYIISKKSNSQKKSHFSHKLKHGKFHKFSLKHKKKYLQEVPVAGPAEKPTAEAGNADAGTDAGAGDAGDAGGAGGSGGASGGSAGGKGEAANKIEDEPLEADDFNIEKCNQVLKATGKYIKDLYNYTARGEMVLMANVYTVSIFSKDDPGSLVTSVDFSHLQSELKSLTGAPECLVLSSIVEKKDLVPCFLSLDLKKDFKKAFKKLIQCREGVDISKKSDDDDDECPENNKNAEKKEKNDDASNTDQTTEQAPTE